MSSAFGQHEQQVLQSLQANQNMQVNKDTNLHIQHPQTKEYPNQNPDTTVRETTKTRPDFTVNLGRGLTIIDAKDHQNKIPIGDFRKATDDSRLAHGQGSVLVANTSQTDNKTSKPTQELLSQSSSQVLSGTKYTHTYMHTHAHALIF
jgi:hypothetical protein